MSTTLKRRDGSATITDKERLDFLEREMLAVFNSTDPDLEPTPGFGKWWVKLAEERFYCKKTLRAAIDGAMADVAKRRDGFQ